MQFLACCLHGGGGGGGCRTAQRPPRCAGPFEVGVMGGFSVPAPPISSRSSESTHAFGHGSPYMAGDSHSPTAAQSHRPTATQRVTKDRNRNPETEG